MVGLTGAASSGDAPPPELPDSVAHADPVPVQHDISGDKFGGLRVWTSILECVDGSSMHSFTERQ